jgi:hypothetical protein
MHNLLKQAAPSDRVAPISEATSASLMMQSAAVDLPRNGNA